MDAEVTTSTTNIKSTVVRRAMFGKDVHLWRRYAFYYQLWMISSIIWYCLYIYISVWCFVHDKYGTLAGYGCNFSQQIQECEVNGRTGAKVVKQKISCHHSWNLASLIFVEDLSAYLELRRNSLMLCTHTHTHTHTHTIGIYQLIESHHLSETDMHPTNLSYISVKKTS